MARKRYPNVYGELRGAMPAWLRRAVFSRDDHTCLYCGRSIYDTASRALHVDHVFSRKSPLRTVQEQPLALAEAGRRGLGPVTYAACRGVSVTV